MKLWKAPLPLQIGGGPIRWFRFGHFRSRFGGSNNTSSFWDGFKRKFTWKPAPLVALPANVTARSSDDGGCFEDADSVENICRKTQVEENSPPVQPPQQSGRLPKCRRFVWHRFPTKVATTEVRPAVQVAAAAATSSWVRPRPRRLLFPCNTVHAQRHFHDSLS